MKIKFTRECNFTTVEAELDTELETYNDDLTMLEATFRYISSQEYNAVKKEPTKQIKPTKQAFKPASPSQIRLLQLHNLIYDGECLEDIDVVEASRRIKESMGQ